MRHFGVYLNHIRLSPEYWSAMDAFILSTMNFACDALSAVGAQKLWVDLCVSQEGASALYYFAIGFWIVLALSVLGAIGSRLRGPDADSKSDRQEPH